MAPTAPASADDLIALARARYPRLSPGEAHDEMATGAILVDTRCADAIASEGAIPGAIRWPLSVLPWRADPASPHRDARIADRSHRLILICAHGYSSSLAAATLLDMGFEHATDVEGGFEAWRAAGLPVVDADA